MIPVVIDKLGKVTQGLVHGLENLEIKGWVKTIQTTALLRLARILGRVQETFCYSNSGEKLSANAELYYNKKNNLALAHYCWNITNIPRKYFLFYGFSFMVKKNSWSAELLVCVCVWILYLLVGINVICRILYNFILLGFFSLFSLTILHD